MIAWTLYPLVFGGSLSVLYYLLYVQQMPIDTITFVILPVAAIVLIMEHISPYRKDWNKPKGDLATDIIYLVLYQFFGVIERAVIPLLALYIITLLPAITSFWPHNWPVVIQVILAVHIYDFFGYWLHRLGHKIPLLWRLHAVHHSPERLWFGNAPRFHIIEIAYGYLISSTSLYLLGADEKVVSLVTMWVIAHGLFQHANIYFKIGVLNYFFSQAELHRWHHSRLINESDTNFGNNVILWDLIFGSFYYPKEREIATIGLVGENYPRSFWGQLLAPFRKGYVDKPDDFKGNEQYYENKIRDENKRISAELGIKN